MLESTATRIIELLRSGADLPASKVKRWFRELDRGAEYSSKQFEARIEVMRWLGANMASRPVKLSRLVLEQARPYDEDRINHYVKADGKHYPIVVIGMPAAGRIEVCDGHHRVMAARRRGRTVIRAVFVVEMDLVEYNAIRARAGA